MKIRNKYIWRGDKRRLTECEERSNEYEWCREGWCPGKVDRNCLVSMTGTANPFCRMLIKQKLLVDVEDRRINKTRVIRVKKR